eukprot:m.194830 g.194830  ORF g.194830 m.194830 type:complete len:91 (+) comp25813_c0_seq8:931-1203(+)
MPLVFLYLPVVRLLFAFLGLWFLPSHRVIVRLDDEPQTRSAAALTWLRMIKSRIEDSGQETAPQVFLLGSFWDQLDETQVFKLQTRSLCI